jgi:hypothetical protein
MNNGLVMRYYMTAMFGSGLKDARINFGAKKANLFSKASKKA